MQKELEVEAEDIEVLVIFAFFCKFGRIPERKIGIVWQTSGNFWVNNVIRVDSAAVLSSEL